MRYAVVTPVRNEAANLERLASCLAAQTVRPVQWIVVDNGSTDETLATARSLAVGQPWITVLADAEAGEGTTRRGGPIVRAFERGVGALERNAEIVVKLDADVSFEDDHFERLLAAFQDEPTLGIASGGAYELEEGEWQPRFNTGTSVWGAARAYRRECLADVRPLEERMGWDGIDELKAQLRGWTTRTLPELPFKHHRAEGARDGSRWKAWAARGSASHYMGYRAWYLVARAVHHSRFERAALGMIWGYLSAAATQRSVCADADVRARLRAEQSIRNVRARRREALGAGRSAAPQQEGPIDVLLVCTGGGHLLQLSSLRAAWTGYTHAWVVASHEGSDVESLLAGDRVFFAHSPACRSLKNLARNLMLARRLLLSLRPQIVLTTGAAVAVPFAWMARLRGVQVVYIESLARAERPSLSCRLVAPVADRTYVQWPELLSALPRARYAGTIFAER